jgi:2-haloacid dehalogenase
MARLSQKRFDQNNYPNLDDIHLEILESLLSEYTLQDKISPEAKIELNMHWHQLVPWNDSAAGLSGLQKSAITATLSNGTVRLLTDLAKYGDLRFDVILSGESFLAFKPNPAMYLGAARLLNLKPDEVCMVAAHDRDLQHAKKHGLVTAFLYRPGEGHDEQEITTDLAHIDICINNLTKLSDLYNKERTRY